MPKARPLEVRAILPLLEQDWEDWLDEKSGNITPGQDRLAEAIILTLDRIRASRTSYVPVLQIGGAKGIYVGMGPFPGRQSAINALKKHPAFGEASGVVVVPVLTAEGYEKQLRDLDKPSGFNEQKEAS